MGNENYKSILFINRDVRKRKEKERRKMQQDFEKWKNQSTSDWTQAEIEADTGKSQETNHAASTLYNP